MNLLSYLLILPLLLFTSCSRERKHAAANGDYQEAPAEKEAAVLPTPDGDTIPAAVPIYDRGKKVSLDSLPQPKIIRAGLPKTFPAHPNIHAAGTPKVVPVPRKLTVITPGEEGVPLPQAFDAEKKVLPARYPKPLPALPPRIKDGARYDLQYLNMDQGLQGGKFTEMIEGHRGHLWIGTVGDGVSCYDGASFWQYTENEGLPNNYVWSVFEDSRGNLWFGQSSGMASRFDGRSFTHYKIGGFVRAMVSDSRY